MVWIVLIYLLGWLAVCSLLYEADDELGWQTAAVTFVLWWAMPLIVVWEKRRYRNTPRTFGIPGEDLEYELSDEAVDRLIVELKEEGEPLSDDEQKSMDDAAYIEQPLSENPHGRGRPVPPWEMP